LDRYAKDVLVTSEWLDEHRDDEGAADRRGRRGVPWSDAIADDGRFLPADELRRVYEEAGVTGVGAPIIAYCRIGERSAHTWFVLSELLGEPDVKNYDGSWTEWGNLVGVPIETGG
jgi:thiosulfate/3-mercaptopyruvate sulfurtransferase